jgi:fructan beta-fructosidase
MKYLLYLSLLIVTIASCKTNEEQTQTSEFKEQYRPQFHFTPAEGWMNDPNGMVYYEGEYHLFYQHFPDGNKWGPMHWGHAISTDLIHWEHLPIALYPDSLGYIFSGSAVIDHKNTTGFGTKKNPAMVAIFTYHDMAGEQAGDIDFQTQGIAYSLDKGRTWTKYKDNPVIKNPGIKDFRDPKVSWYEPEQKWVMILAVKDHTEIYASKDLKSWIKESEFGKSIGAHGGVWECPDLFPLEVENNNTKWVMLVSINPGGPQGGSATQYFVGDFDGKTFIPDDTETRWVDHGADNYAGVTFSNIPEKDERTIFMGWMSNWQYAQDVPTEKWRSAMTIPRELSLLKKGTDYLLKSTPISAINKLIEISDKNKSSEFLVHDSTFVVTLNAEDLRNVSVNLVNDDKEVYHLYIKDNKLVSDRTKAGRNEFSKAFAAIHEAPLGGIVPTKVQVFVDASSVEIFINDGELVMTELLFPTTPYKKVNVYGKVSKFTVSPIKSIWLQKP